MVVVGDRLDVARACHLRRHPFDSALQSFASDRRDSTGRIGHHFPRIDRRDDGF